MKIKKQNFEERTIEGKKVRIRTILFPYYASAGLDGKTITLNEKTKKELSGKELNSILLHERGHLTRTSYILTYIPVIIGFGAILYFLVNYLELIKNILSLKIPIIFTLIGLVLLMVVLFLVCIIIEFPFMWAREIYADWYAVKRTKKDIFGKSLKRFYKYNKEIIDPSWKRFYYGVILHPPQPIRLRIIKFMEKIRDKQ